MHPVLWNEEIRKSKKGKLSFHFCGDDKTVEVVLRTITSVNQLSIYGAVADMCDELACRISDCSESREKFVAQRQSRNYSYSSRIDDHEQITRTDENVQGNLLQDYEQKFASRPYRLQLTKLCSNVGITKTVARGQYFTTLDDAEL